MDTAATWQMSLYHEPVLREAAVVALVWDPSGTYVDATFGGGGHSRLILRRLSSCGRLIGIDQDPEAPLEALCNPRFKGVRANFRHLEAILAEERLSLIAGVLLDLGVSSHQLDTAQRGFSYRWEGPLDLRMNPEEGMPAYEWLVTVPTETLAECLRRYGDLPQARALAVLLQTARPKTTVRLRALVESFYGKRKGQALLAQVFQALRIAVNDEMGALKEVLAACTKVVMPGGRLVVLTYHSGEARQVKQLYQTPSYEDPLSGQRRYAWQLLEKLRPTLEEIAHNPRSRSAQLWVLEKNA